ncbi:MAG: glycosyltransferase family 9 protein, partial [Chloroflexi bacterium]|nr:glycosyltransferase family 9 protein [Chloroflexota bacterium]
VAMHVGSGGAHKRWSLDNFFALAERIVVEGNRRVLLMHGPAEDLRELIQHRPADGAAVVGTNSLSDAAALLELCSLYIGNDSGITHLAAALGVPTLALFGPTDPAIWGPRGTRVRIVRSPTARMDDLSVEQVWQDVRQWLMADSE